MECKFTKDHLASHHENRHKICLLCFGKTKKMFAINVLLLDSLKKALKTDILLEDHLPCALCSSCKRKVCFAVSESNSRKVTLNLPDFSKFRGEIKSTRSSVNKSCSCYLCDLARKLYISKTMNTKINKMFLNSKKVSVTKRCIICCSDIKKGVKHTCNKSTCVSNLTQDIKNKLNPYQKKRIICNLLQDESNSEIRSTIEPEVIKKPVISVEDMINIKIKHNLSNNTTEGIAADLRVAALNRKLFEPGLKKALIRKNHTVDTFFSIKKTTFKKTKNKVESFEEQTVIYCNDLNGFINYVKDKRNVVDVHLKLGIDGGGGFLKVCLSIQSLNADGDDDDDAISKSKRRKFQDNIRDNTFKDSGVKKLFIIAIAPNAQENYENVQQMWNLLKLDQLQYTIAADLKLCNILTGLMTHSSMYPCTWCDVRKNSLETRGNELRTIRNCTDNYNQWLKQGANKKDSKDFKSCIHVPIFTSNFSVNTTILGIIPPPELHLLLGVINTIVDKMSAELECEKITNDWFKECSVKRDNTHAGSGFNGNDCKTLLKNLDTLRAKKDLRILKYVDTLSKFNDVVEDCFGNQLNPGYEKKIEIFKKSYLNLEISTTPKVHAVFFHIEDFCSKIKKGLGYYSEQAMESVHFDFLKTWANYKVKNATNESYNNQLLRAICNYNGNHV